MTDTTNMSVMTTAVTTREGTIEDADRFSGLRQYIGFIPALLLLGLFFILPLALIVAYSFWRVIDYRIVTEWTLENYQYFFSVPVYARNLLVTVIVAAASTAITIALAFPFAYWVTRYVSRRIQKPLLILLIIPLWTSYLLRIYAWISILGEQGALNRFLSWGGLRTEAMSSLLYDRPAVVLVLVYLYFPFAALILYTALDGFDWRQLKSAMDLGSSPLGAIRRVMLPQIRPAITTAVVLVLIPTLGEYLVPQLIGGARGLMIGNLITNFFMGAQYARGAAASLLIVAIIVLLLATFRRSLEIRGGTGATTVSHKIESASGRASLVRALLYAYGASIYLFLFAPIALLVMFSFNANRIGTFPITGWTLEWYRSVFSNFQIQDAFLTSVSVAAQVTVIAVVVGTSAAFAIVRSRLKYRNAVRVVLLLPIMIPGLLIGVSLLVLFGSALGMRLSMQTAVIGQSVFISPFVMLIVSARLRTFDERLEHAASDLGANALRRLRHVVMPILLPSVFAGALFAFTLSIDEFIITLFLIGGHNTLPMYIFTQLRFGITPEVNALAALLLGASFSLVGLSVSLPAVYQRIHRRYAVRPGGNA